MSLQREQQPDKARNFTGILDPGMRKNKLKAEKYRKNINWKFERTSQFGGNGKPESKSANTTERTKDGYPLQWSDDSFF